MVFRKWIAAFSTNKMPRIIIIITRDNNTAKLYFIIETKIDKEDKDLTTVEKRKIRCGKLHFRAVSSDVDFHWG